MIVMLAPLPPFLGGAAMCSATIARQLQERGHRVVKLNTMQTAMKLEHRKSMLLYALRMLVFVKNGSKLLLKEMQRNAYLVYHAPDAGKGLWLTYLYLKLIKPFNKKVVLHHHTYRYVNVKSGLMQRIVNDSWDRIHHVFLDPDMMDLFHETYGRSLHAVTLSNLATCEIDVSKTSLPQASRPTTIGYLSNLVDEKGFDVVEELFIRLHNAFGDTIQLLLAGPPVDAVARRRLDRLVDRLGESLHYLGPVHGESKRSFFSSCDIFVFPTRFAQEAQPFVVYEAMASGSLIVASRWAGIPWQLEGTLSRMIEVGNHMAEAFFEEVSDFVRSGGIDAHRREQRRRCAEKLKHAALEHQRFFDLFKTDGVSPAGNDASRTHRQSDNPES